MSSGPRIPGHFQVIAKARIDAREIAAVAVTGHGNGIISSTPRKARPATVSIPPIPGPPPTWSDGTGRHIDRYSP